MKSDFEYNNEYVAQNQLTIDNIGNCCIEGINEDELFYYYLLIKTEMGMSKIFTYGPVVPGVSELTDKYMYSYEQIKYNDKKMYGYILKWLNDRTKGITVAEVIDESEFLDNVLDLNKFVKDEIGG